MLRIAPICPACEARQILPHSTEDGCPLGGIAKIQTKEGFVRLVQVAWHPLPHDMNTTFKAARHSNSNLQGSQPRSSLRFHGLAPQLAGGQKTTAIGCAPSEGLGKACNDAPAT